MEILPEHVRPGDLITADFMNRLLVRLDALEGRIEKLEGNGIDDGSVAITQLIPSGAPGDPIRVGQELQILGRHFGFSVGGHRVSFDSTLITAYKLGSSDNLLVVDVPDLSGLPPGGGPVALTVSNGSTFDTRTITVHPIQQALTGDVFVQRRDDLTPNPNPNPIPHPDSSSSPTVTFAYRLRSEATLPATFTIVPSISVSSWQSSVVVLDEAGSEMSNPHIRLEPNESANFFVRATLTPIGMPISSFNLTLVASAGAVVGTNSKDFPIGEPVEEGDPAISLNLTDHTVFDLTSGDVDSSGGSFNEATDTITVAQGFRLTMEFDAVFDAATRYDVTVEAGDGTHNWSIQLKAPSTGFYDASEAEVPVNKFPRFAIEPQEDASDMGAVIFRIQRQGESRSQTRTFTLALQS